MKRLINLSFLLTLAIMALLLNRTSGASYDGRQASQIANLPGTGWWMGQQVMNAGTGNATITSAVFAPIATVEASDQTWPAALPAGIAPGASTTFLPDQYPGLGGTNVFGSALIQSNQPIKGILNLTNREYAPYGGVPGGKAIAQYQGIEGIITASKLFAPIAKKAFPPGPPWTYAKTSVFFIQNAGQRDISISTTYLCSGTPYNFNSLTIRPGERVELTPLAPIQDGSLCSATFESNPVGNSLAGSAYEYYTNEPVPIKTLQATRLFTEAEYDDNIFAPVYKYMFKDESTMSDLAKRSTGVQIQNVGANTVSVTAYYYYSDQNILGPCASNSTLVDSITGANIPAGGSRTFLYPSGMPEGCIASAKFFASGGRIVGVENESYLHPVPTYDYQSATAFNLILEGTLTTKALLPLYKENFGLKSSALYVQNTSGSPASITIEFRSSTSVWRILNQVIDPYEMKRYFRVNLDGSLTWENGVRLPEGSNTGVTVIANQPIASVVTEVTLETGHTFRPCFGGTTCFDQQNYEGFNVSP
jgi:hypothetical protein